MSTPSWALSLSYWLHMLATVAWLGGLAAASLLVLPIISKTGGSGEQLKLLHRLQKRLDPVGWLSLLVLVGTGLTQMSASERYEGFLSISSSWAASILFKHIVFSAMIAVSGYLTWRAIPELSRLVLRQSMGKAEAGELERMQRRHTLLLRLNLALGAVVLVFTALARVAA